MPALPFPQEAPSQGRLPASHAAPAPPELPLLDEWFPSLRDKLKRLTPGTAPRFVESVSGALAAALLAWCLWQGAALLWSGCAAVGSAIGGLFSPKAPTENEEFDGSQPSRGARPQADIKAAEKPLPKEAHGDLLPWALPHADKSIDGLSRQADEAIMQALRRCGMDSSRVRTLQTVPKELSTPRRQESYKLQRMQIFLTDEPKQFEKVLRTGLKSAGSGLEAALQKSGERPVLRVQTRGVVTHELFLFKAGEAFMLPPGGTPPLLSLVLTDTRGDAETIKGWLDLDIPLAFALRPDEAYAAAEEIFKDGQEVILWQPFSTEPYDPAGRRDILHSNVSPEVTRRVIRQNLSSLPQATALLPGGDEISEDKNASQALALAAAECGLAIVDPAKGGKSPLLDEAIRQGLASTRVSAFLNEGTLSQEEIYRGLCKFAAKMKKGSHAVLMLRATPESRAAAERWSREREDDATIVPLRYQPKENGPAKR